MDYFRKKSDEFKVIRFTIIIATVLFLGFTAIREFSNYKKTESLTGKIYAIDPQSGTVLSMTKRPFTMEERKAEYEAHVRDFITHFYQFDQYTFIQNIDYSRNLINKESFDREIAKYQEENTLGRLEERDIIVTATKLNIAVDITQKPYKGSFSFIQALRTSTNYRERIIEATYEIADTQGRTFENPHACLITNFIITRKEIME